MVCIVDAVNRGLAALGQARGVDMLAVRALLAWEFGEAGLGKLHGENWFGLIQGDFPFPLNHVPAEISWHLATWAELTGAALLVLGLATRFTSLSLLLLTAVAWASVHAGHGYNVCDNGWKLPLIYLVLLLPLLFGGAGRLSLDHLLARRLVSCRPSAV